MLAVPSTSDERVRRSVLTLWCSPLSRSLGLVDLSLGFGRERRLMNIRDSSCVQFSFIRL
jgi:hypothetical protein